MAGFIFKQAETEEELIASYRLRYQVYCVERGFEPKEKYPDGLERDKYDPHSVHFIALDSEKNIIGTIRLVKKNDIGFPAVEHCKFRINLDNIPSDNMAEISRLAISKVLRRRNSDGTTGLADPVADAEEAKRLELENRRRNPEIFLGLYKAIYRESKWLGIENWICAMERSLHILLKRNGVPFVQVGDEIDYHGKRAPYIARVSVIERTMARERPLFFQYITEWARMQVYKL